MTCSRVFPDMSSAFTKIFVGNLPWTVSSRELRQYFMQFGKVRAAKVVFSRETGFSKGFGFVHFDNNESLEGMKSHNLHQLEGNVIRVEKVHESMYKNQGPQ